MPEILKKELHLHLFGCLTTEDLWEIGIRKNPRPESLGWYVEEFDRVNGRKPNPSLYFTGDKERDLLQIKRDYECTEKVSFAQFQASFNLAIALNPDRFADAHLLKAAVQRQKQQGVDYSEFRLVLPPRLSREEQIRYLEYMNNACIQLSSDQFTTKLILTLFRDSKTLDTDYELVKNWQHKDSQFVAIDFCMDEQISSPDSKIKFVDRMKKDNLAQPESALDLAYHVGETYDRIGLAVSASWISQACKMGIKRLGHALSMGIDPDRSAFILREIPASLLEQHLLYTLDRLPDLHSYDFPYNSDKISAFIKNLPENKSVPWPPPEKARDVTIAWQQLAMDDVRNSASIVECCPTSNYILGEMTRPEDHPISQFLEANLGCVISTDDPGIFALDLSQEEKRLKESCNITDDQLSEMNELAINIAKSQPMLR